MEVSIRLLGAIELLLSWLVYPLLYILSWCKLDSLPPIDDPVLFESASKLAYKIRTKQVSSEKVVKSYIRRIKEVNSRLNAVVEDRFSEALEEARMVDSLVQSGERSAQQMARETPFLGVPFTVKESCALKGMSQSVGCKPRRGELAARDGASVARLRRCGAVPLAVTNTPELCLCWETDNLLTGRTRNPYNPARTAGGSSGGEGALLGAGASLIGIGSDIAGSIRIPAMFNGVYGHKPTPGYISTDGHFPNSPDEDFNKYLVVGPMTRYAEDLKPLMKVMVDNNYDELRLDEEVNLTNVHIFYKMDAGFSFVAIPVEKEIKSCMNEAINYLREKYKCLISEARFDELIDSVEMSISVFLGMEGIPNILSYANTNKKEPNLYMEILKSCIGKSDFSYQGLIFMFVQKFNMFIPKRKYGSYYIQAQSLRNKFKEVLGEDSVLIYPTYPIPAFHHHEFTIKTAGVMYTMIFNILGLPSTHIPTGLNRQGLPIGFQVIGGPGQDRLCLAVAQALEAKFGGWRPPS